MPLDPYHQMRIARTLLGHQERIDAPGLADQRHIRGDAPRRWVSGRRDWPLPVTGSPFSLVAHYFGPALAFGVCHSICFKWSLCPACVFDALSVALDYRATLSYIFSVKEIAYSRTAQKALTRMPRNWAERIMEKIRAYAEDPESQANNITGLKGSDSLSRLRVGDWRIIMRSGVVLHVLDVTIRGSAYKE